MRWIITNLLIVVLVFGCKKEQLNLGKKSCTTLATVRDLHGVGGCGFVFELENGQRLDPIRLFYCGTPPIPKLQLEDPLISFEFVEGKKVKIGYEKVENQVSACMVGPVVKITCLEELPVDAKE